MLKIENLKAYYGEVQALYGIDLEVKDGEICCLIGANGAGKSTLLKSISGMVHKTGKILWNDQDLSGYSAQKVAKQGIIHVPEGRQVFPGLSVYQNLEVGSINWHGFFGNKPYDEDIEMIYELFPRLKERSKQLAWSLSGGEQQMLAIGRGLMGRPKLLMLDEPSMGLAPLVIAELFEKIVDVNKKLGVPILLIEQNSKLALKVSNYAYVIKQGKIQFEGKAEEMRNDPRVQEAYFAKFGADQEGK